MARKKQIYRQCTLVREISENSSIQIVTYIPQHYAKKGKIVKLKEDTGDNTPKQRG